MEGERGQQNSPTSILCSHKVCFHVSDTHLLPHQGEALPRAPCPWILPDTLVTRASAPDQVGDRPSLGRVPAPGDAKWLRKPSKYFQMPQTHCGASQLPRPETFHADSQPPPKDRGSGARHTLTREGARLLGGAHGPMVPWRGQETRRADSGVSRLPFLLNITRGHSQTRDRGRAAVQGNVSKFSAGPRLSCSQTRTSNGFQVVLTAEARPGSHKNT